MADYYCLLESGSTGSITDASIWSDSPGGSPGTTIPASTDKLIFSVSCIVENVIPNTIGSVVIPESIEVTFVRVISNGTVVRFSNGELDIRGTLILNSQTANGNYRISDQVQS